MKPDIPMPLVVSQDEDDVGFGWLQYLGGVERGHWSQQQGGEGEDGIVHYFLLNEFAFVMTTTARHTSCCG